MKRLLFLVSTVAVLVLVFAGVAHAATPIDMHEDYINTRPNGFTQTYTESELRACLTHAGLLETADLRKHKQFVDYVTSVLAGWPTAAVSLLAASTESSAAEPQGGEVTAAAQLAPTSSGRVSSASETPAATGSGAAPAGAASDQTAVADTQDPTEVAGSTGAAKPSTDVGVSAATGGDAPASRWHFALFGMVAIPGVGGGAVWLRQWRQKRRA